MGRQPLGLASPLGFLRGAGFPATGLDLAVEAFDSDRVARARWIAISVPMHTALRLGVAALRHVRSVNPRAHVTFYGLYAHLNADFLLAEGADSVVTGEREESLVSLAEALDRGGDPALVAGIQCRGGATPARGPTGRPTFALPSRHGLPPLRKYARLLHQGEERLAGCVEASRGCLHGCLHCPIPPVHDGSFFIVPLEIVLEDIRALAEAGAEHITFADPDFLNGPGHSLRVLRAMHAELPRLTFDFTAKVEHLLRHRALLAEFRALGCAFVVSAVESLSDIVLVHLQKGHTGAGVLEVIGLLRGAGIPLRPSFVSFTPWTTLDDYLDVLDLIAVQDLGDHVDPVQLAIRLLLPPGSRLLLEPSLRPFLGRLDEAALSHRWTHPDPRMDRLHADVAAIVEEDAASEVEPAVTLERIGAAAFSLHPWRRPALWTASATTARIRPPRLTEAWFC